MQHFYTVYIISNQRHTVLYVGVTNDLARRLQEHREGAHSGFSKKYNLCKLLYFEKFRFVEEAIRREKQIKGGSRIKKVELIQKMNPGWIDLSLKNFM